jgi:hypothetical protein
MRRDSGSGGMVLLILLLLMSSAGLGVAYYMGYLDQFIKKDEDDDKDDDEEDEDDDEDEDEDDEAPEAPEVPDASAFPTDIPNLSGRYTTESFDDVSREWVDVSGKNNNVTTRKGDIKRQIHMYMVVLGRV